MMKGLLFALFTAAIFRNVAIAINTAKDDCRDVIFKQPITDKALVGHVIANMTVENKVMCNALCYNEPNCVSTNFNTAPGAKENCELNSKDDKQRPEDLVNKPGVVYQAIENFCNNQTCTSGNMTGCQSGFHGDKGYRCSCLKCFQGEFCEKVVNHQDIVMHFPTKNISHRVPIENPFPVLSAFTISMWVQMGPDSTSFPHTPFSYSSATNPDEILIYIQGTSALIFLRRNKLTVSYPFNALPQTQWVHICVSWENTNGVLKGYINGTEYASGNGINTGETIPQGGLMLGQEQDTYMGGLVSYQALKGNLTSVNVWDHVLTEREVADLAMACPATREGNALKWSDVFQYKTDSVGYFCGTHCRP